MPREEKHQGERATAVWFFLFRRQEVSFVLKVRDDSAIKGEGKKVSGGR